MLLFVICRIDLARSNLDLLYDLRRIRCRDASRRLSKHPQIVAAAAGRVDRDRQDDHFTHAAGREHGHHIPSGHYVNGNRIQEQLTEYHENGRSVILKK